MYVFRERERTELAVRDFIIDSCYNYAPDLKKNMNIIRREMEAISQGSKSYNLWSKSNPLPTFS